MGDTTRRRHVRRSRKAWQHLVDEQARSGLSQAAFCAAHSLSVSTFQHWKRRLGTTAAQAAWVDLGQVGVPPSGAWKIELDLGSG